MFVNQPYDLQLGPNLIAEIASNNYDSLSFIVAYAKLSGVYRLEPSLQNFKSNGGKIKCVVGIDQKNTTFEALERLYAIADELYIFHSEIYSQTFHPKCYWLYSKDKLWFAVGSNNLTAGGLFSNYEMSYSDHLTGTDAANQLTVLNNILDCYSDSNSACCRRVDLALINDLYQNGYIEKEFDQKKRLLKERTTSQNSQSKSIFGKEVFKAPALPVVASAKGATNAPKQTMIKSTLPTAIAQSTGSNEYLIRHVPKAGGRSKQVHFTIDLLNNFFGLKQGDPIILQEVKANGTVSPIENHQVVFSQKNRNVKIEMSGAAILDTQYPADPNKRPVLIVKHISNNFFTYTLLLDGDAGYSPINLRLSALPLGRSLANELIDESTMLSLWPTCPIV